jgi:hypothetical protein
MLSSDKVVCLVQKRYACSGGLCRLCVARAVESRSGVTGYNPRSMFGRKQVVIGSHGQG